MLQTLFRIPNEVDGVPLFGFGVLFWAWLAWCVFYGIMQSRRQGWTSELMSSLGFMALLAGVIAFVIPRVMEPDEAGRLGIAIRGYGVMLLLGIVGGVALCVYRGKRYGVSADTIFSLALWLFVAGMIGARTFYVVEYWKDFQRGTMGETIGAVVNLTKGGLVVFGGLIGGTTAMVVFARKHGLPLLPLLDLTAPCMTLGLALGRVGCFMNGCCFGGACDLPWAVEFPAGSPPHMRQVEQGKAFGFQLAAGKTDAGPTVVVADVERDSRAERAGLRVGETVRGINNIRVDSVEQARALLVEAVQLERTPLQMETDRGIRIVDFQNGLDLHSLPIHPAQLYSAFDGLLLTLLLLAFDPLKRHMGETFALLLMVHSVSRFLLEVIRIDEPAVFGTGLSISQNISIGMLAVGVGLFLFLECRSRGGATPNVARV